MYENDYDLCFIAFNLPMLHHLSLFISSLAIRLQFLRDDIFSLYRDRFMFKLLACARLKGASVLHGKFYQGSVSVTLVVCDCC